MRVWISDFLALLYTRLLSFCLVLFAAWSAFFTGLAAAAARTNTGRLANGTTTREVHDTPSNTKKNIHRQNPHNPGQIGFTPPKKKTKTPNPEPIHISREVQPLALQLGSFRRTANRAATLPYPHPPSQSTTLVQFTNLPATEFHCKWGWKGQRTKREREQSNHPHPHPHPTAHWLICYSPNTLNRFELHVKSRRWPWSRVPAKEERSGTEAEERCAVQTEAEGEAANASDDSDEVTLEHAMAIAAPSPAMQCNAGLQSSPSSLISPNSLPACAYPLRHEKRWRRRRKRRRRSLSHSRFRRVWHPVIGPCMGMPVIA